MYMPNLPKSCHLEFLHSIFRDLAAVLETFAKAFIFSENLHFLYIVTFYNVKPQCIIEIANFSSCFKIIDNERAILCLDVASGNKPVYACELCPTTCGRKTDLRIHVQKLHTSDKPLKCKKCGKAFPDR